MLLRRLATSGALAPEVLGKALAVTLAGLPAVVDSLQADPSADALRKSGAIVGAMHCLGALCVLGGSLPSLFVGCRVAVEADEGDVSAGSQEGMLVRWDGAEDSAALVLLDTQISELRLLSVSALQLHPLDEASLPSSSFSLSPALVGYFRPFFPKMVEELGGSQRIVVLKTELQSAFLFGLLQTRALKALQELLRHPASMRVVLDSGLLPAIMVSAATPVPLLGIHHTDSLQVRLTRLEQMHVEAASAARFAKVYAAAARSGRSQRNRPAASAGSASAGSGTPRSPRPSTGSAYSASLPSQATAAEGSNLGLLKQQLDNLVSMGFDPMLCQRAVMKFGVDVNSAIEWLTDDQAQHEQRRQMHRSPSWEKADNLASTMGFSSAVCKKALEKNQNDLNRAANWLFEHGPAAEEELDNAPEEVTVVAAADAGEAEEEDVGRGEAAPSRPNVVLRTVSFRPGGLSRVPTMQGRRGSVNVELLTSGPDETDASQTEGQDEFQSAAPPPPPPLPGETLLDAASREGGAPLSRRLSRANAADEPMPPLRPEEVLVGRLLRPTPLAANRNAVVASMAEGLEMVRLITRAAETDGLEVRDRHLRHCQRAEASLAAIFPELRQLGANSSGLNAVSGAAHTALAIMLLRQALVYLLADMGALQQSHADGASAFKLDQLGQPRDLLDLLKLAYHSSGGSGVGGAALGATVGRGGNSSPFAKLWGLMESLVRPDNEAVQLPAVLQALPRLLRDDALKHLRRELSATHTLQSPHPLSEKQTKLRSVAELRVAGASQMMLHLDARSNLPGTACLRFCADEAGLQIVAQWQGTAAGWSNRLVHGDTLWVHLEGEVPLKELRKKPWGFSVRVSAAGWVPPDVESGALDAPLAIGWPLLELLSTHRPTELLTKDTYRALTRCVHRAEDDGPYRALAASLLLRLLKLPSTALPLEMREHDPRELWPLEPLLSLSTVVEQHNRPDGGTVDRISGLLAPHVQLCAELVAQAHLRASKERAPPRRPSWVETILELSAAAAYFGHVAKSAAGGEGALPVPALPERWVDRVAEKMGASPSQVAECLAVPWPVEKYTALVKYAANVAAIKVPVPEPGKAKERARPSELSPAELPALREGGGGRIEGTSAGELRCRHALLQTFNTALVNQMALVWTGYTDPPHTLGAELCGLRELIFPDVKHKLWGAALDATASIQEPKYFKEHPPPIAVINRHRAGKERSDRRARMRHSIFAQLHAQLQFVPSSALQRRDRSFKVKFSGEAADDYGGPYREVLTSLCGELQTPATLPMLLLSPNGQHSLGSNRDKYIMDPAATTAELLKWFEFLGALCGMALLQQDTVLSLNLCSVVWKQLVQSAPDHTDLAGYDEMACQSLLKMADCEAEGIDEGLFGDLFFETFTAQLSNGATVEVCEGGSNLDVTFANRRRFCDLVMRARLHEGHAQTHAMLRGLNALLPARLLPLFTHTELELMTCGAPDIDISILRKHTRYGVSVDPARDEHIALLWRVLEAFSADQRSKFLTFIWSRNRLPQTDEEWGDQCMKVHTLETSTPDHHFPVSHTCFFSIEWPRYTSFKAAKEKLLYAIVNCTDMDMDATAEGRANAAMSFEDPE